MGHKSYSQIKEFQNWNSISIDKEITKKASLLFDEEFRFENNASQFQSTLTTLGAQYKISKYLKVKSLYRYTYANTFEDGVETEHRFSADVMMRYKTNRITFGYRARYQMEYINFDVNTWHTLRNKFSAKYDIPKSHFLPYVEYEFYYPLNNPIQNSITKNRYTLGAEYEIYKNVSLSAYYRIQIRQAYSKYALNKYILGLGASISL